MQAVSLIYGVNLFLKIKWQISLPAQLVKSVLFYIPDVWKGYSFRAEPFRIRRYREPLPLENYLLDDLEKYDSITPCKTEPLKPCPTHPHYPSY